MLLEIVKKWRAMANPALQTTADIRRSMKSVLSECRQCARHYGPHAIVAYLFNLVRVGRAERAERFDERFGTVTAELAYPWHLPSIHSQTAGEIYPYAATPAWLVRAILGSISIEPDRFAFIDMGSGKGRVLLLASEFPFARIVGIELSRELHDVAEENIRRHEAATQGNAPYELHCMNALAYEFGPEPLVLFLFNPFGEDSLHVVLARLNESLRKAPRQAFVIYINPRFERALQRSRNFRKVGGGGTWLQPWQRYVIYQATIAPAGPSETSPRMRQRVSV